MMQHQMLLLSFVKKKKFIIKKNGKHTDTYLNQRERVFRAETKINEKMQKRRRISVKQKYEIYTFK